MATLDTTTNVLTLRRGDTLSIAYADLGVLTGRTALQFTVKERTAGADSAAVLQITEAGGLVYLIGAAPVVVVGQPAKTGSITVTDAPTGDITIAASAAATAELPVQYGLPADIQMVSAAGVTTLWTGTVDILPDVTRAIA